MYYIGLCCTPFLYVKSEFLRHLHRFISMLLTNAACRRNLNIMPHLTTFCCCVMLLLLIIYVYNKSQKQQIYHTNTMHNKKARRARKQNIDYAKQHHTPHCWMPSKVMYPANSTKSLSWMTRSSPIFYFEERSNIYKK